MTRPKSRLSVTARLAAAWYLLAGLAAVTLGAHELLLAVQFTYRLLGVALAVVGAALVASSVGFALRQGWCYSYSVVAGIAAGIFATLFLVAQWVNLVHDYRLAIWATAAILCFATALAVGREGRIRLGRFARHRVQVASSLLSIGALLSIAQFWNAAVRVPPTSAPSISVKGKLEPGPRTGGADLAATVTIKNTGSAKVWVLGSLYNLVAESMETPAENRMQNFEDEVASILTQQVLGSSASRHRTTREKAVIATGQLLGPHTYLVPDEQHTFRLLFHAPPNRYDAVRLVTSVIIAKDTLVLEEVITAPKLVNDIHGKRVVGRINVRETSWLSRIFRGRRYLETEVSFDHSQGYLYLNLRAYLDRYGHEPTRGADEYSLRLSRLYGLAYADSDYALSLR